MFIIDLYGNYIQFFILKLLFIFPFAYSPAIHEHFPPDICTYMYVGYFSIYRSRFPHIFHHKYEYRITITRLI